MSGFLQAMLGAIFPLLSYGTTVSTAQTGGNIKATIVFNTNGTITANTTGTGTNVSTGYPGTWLPSGGEGGNYWVRFNYVSGTASPFTPEGVWTSLASAVEYGQSTTSSIRTVTSSFQISSDSSGSVILASSSNVTFTSNST